MEYNEYRGVRGLVLAEVIEDNGVYKTGKWQRLSGTQSVSITSNESSEAHYYDNLSAIVIDAEGADEVALVVSVLANKTRALIDGVSYDETKDMVVGTPKHKKYFALGFIGEKTNGVEEINILYKGKFSGGAESHNTKDDGTEATNIEYTYTAIHTSSLITTNNGVLQPAKNVKLPIKDTVTEAAVFGTFTEDVSTLEAMTPDEIKALS